MKASVRWLRELCPGLPDDPAAIAARFTAAGLEVEGTHAYGLGAEACVAAAVVSTRPHPSRTGLRLVTVDRGGAQQEVVCGAPNVPEAGGLVVLAPLGAHLPAKGMTIEKRTIAGVASEGMLCSEAELGLSEDGQGILVLAPGTAAPGTPFVKALPAARDTVLEIGLTPNRPDGLGHVGLAREAAALFGIPFALPVLPPPASVDEDPGSCVTVSIEDAERCPHFGSCVLLGGKVAPSPLDVRWRLASLGVRSVSNLVDVTNLVMLETGHPLHAYDLLKVRGRTILVRRAAPGEKLVTLDGVERALDPDDLVICDGEGPVGLAGVMGGGNSEISGETTNVLLECAYFDARGVRRAARRHGMHTEASHRFERGVDWGDTQTTLLRAATMMGQLGGTQMVKEPRVFEARALARRTVTLRHARPAELLGVDVPHEDTRGILGRLGFGLRSSQPGMDVWEVPSHRPDVSREVDLVEEVARVRGFDAIPATLPAVRASRDEGPREALRRRAREAGVALGLSEAITYSFVAQGDLDALGAPPAAVTLVNPLSERGTVMRTSLLPGLLRGLANARRHRVRDARLFTVGALFLPLAAERTTKTPLPERASPTPETSVDERAGARGSDPGAQAARLPDERIAFAAVLAGDRPAWLERPRAVDVWDAKGVAEGMVQRLVRREVTLRACAAADRPKHLHPRGAAWIEVEGKRAGSLGPLHPDVVGAFDLGDGAVVLELDLQALQALGAKPLRFAPLPRFPASTRDLAIVVRDEVPAGDVEHAVRAAAGDLGEAVALFDRFVGGNVPTGHASLALHVVYRAPDRTLTDAEVDQRHAHVLAEVEKRFGAQLRS
ncbi:MAG TPA: phenylalanine--tRNA ligase subunit beta [Polyangiaceae bacterium]|jgi:phenylalanyl-tRNA synthetase beta chain